MFPKSRQCSQGRPLGKIFQLTPTSIAIDFRLPEGRYLFISVEPARPRLYLIKRTVKDLEKSSIPPSIFVLSVRKHFSGARLREMRKEPSDRIVHFEFDGFDQAGASCRPVLVAQLTGRSSKLYALDENLKILATLRVNREMDLTSGAVYVPPPTPVPASLPAIVREPAFARAQFDDLSEAADHYYTQREDEQLFQARAKTELSRVKKSSASGLSYSRH
ncbi:MAG: NFACT family protein [Pyrinomonadaceae bacterium]